MTFFVHSSEGFSEQSHSLSLATRWIKIQLSILGSSKDYLLVFPKIAEHKEDTNYEKWSHFEIMTINLSELLMLLSKFIPSPTVLEEHLHCLFSTHSSNTSSLILTLHLLPFLLLQWKNWSNQKTISKTSHKHVYLPTYIWASALCFLSGFRGWASWLSIRYPTFSVIQRLCFSYLFCPVSWTLHTLYWIFPISIQPCFYFSYIKKENKRITNSYLIPLSTPSTGLS